MTVTRRDGIGWRGPVAPDDTPRPSRRKAARAALQENAVGRAVFRIAQRDRGGTGQGRFVVIAIVEVEGDGGRAVAIILRAAVDLPFDGDDGGTSGGIIDFQRFGARAPEPQITRVVVRPAA